MSSFLDGIEYGIQMGDGASLLMAADGIDCQRYSRLACWEAISFLSAPQARYAARRMERLLAKQATFTAVMKQEQRVMLTDIYHRLRQPDWRGHDLSEQIRHRHFHRRRIFTAYQSFAGQCIAYAAKPYPMRGKAPSEPWPEGREGIDYPMRAHFTPGQRNYRYNMLESHCDFTKNATQNALLTVSFALHAYQQEHRAYPKNLSQLVPKYLSRIPDDPFALKRPLSYRKTASGYLLYSIGPDGKDNAGTPCSKDWISPSSKRDIVAGVNVQ